MTITPRPCKTPASQLLLCALAIGWVFLPVTRPVSAASAHIRASATVISPLGANGTSLLAPPSSSIFVQLERPYRVYSGSYYDLQPGVSSAFVATISLSDLIESLEPESTGSSPPLSGRDSSPVVLTVIYTEN